MAKWFPKPEETFAFERDEGRQKILLLIPTGTFDKEPYQLMVNGYEFELDEEKTEEVRMFIRVAERKRTGED